MKRVKEILICYALIPLAASVAGFALGLIGLSRANFILVPLLVAAIYALFRKKMDLAAMARINGILFLVLLGCFTVMMAISSGNVEGVLMSNFNWFILPFAPIILIHMLSGQNTILFAAALLSYACAFAVTALLGKARVRRMLLPAVLALACIIADVFLYTNRPSVRYAGHGFEYMHGYSSTDFTDYTVYSSNSKLVMPEEEPTLIIEREEDMPVMDGAEACYPLYAAFARAVYRDIDEIEKKWLAETNNPYCNGKIVTFTNTVMGFSRLLMNGEDREKYGDGVDMFFGARPSASQMQEAEERGIELQITPIGREAFVFFVEEDNPVDGLTSDQLIAIYHGDITNWSEVGGRNQEILAFQRPHNSGSQTMMEYFMGDVTLKEPQTYETVDAMTGVIRQVAQYANEKGAMGYSFRYFLEGLNQEKGVKMLSVDGVYPSLENIENGSYPLVTNVCLITRKDDPNPYVQKMIDYILSEQGQYIVRETGYAGVAEKG